MADPTTDAGSPARLIALGARYATESALDDQLRAVAAQRDHHQREELHLHDQIAVLEGLLRVTHGTIQRVLDLAGTTPPRVRAPAKMDGWKMAMAAVVGVLTENDVVDPDRGRGTRVNVEA